MDTATTHQETHQRHLQTANRLVVIGASLGGVAALPDLLSGLPKDFPCPVLVVLHIDAHRSELPRLLSAQCAMPAMHAVDGEMLQSGRIYVAPPDQHMMVDGPVVVLTRAAKEHHARPAIDPLFRSAALSRGANVIGVVLTGMLSDGSFGLQAIKEAGGMTLVQNPDEAVEPAMPLAALRTVDIDHCLPLNELAGKLIELVAAPRPLHPWVQRRQTEIEQAVFLRKGDSVENLTAIAVPSPYVCPDCKGGLWSLKDVDPPRFRCHTGHAYGLDTLEHSQSEATDEALWTATRAVQEKMMLMEELAASRRQLGDQAQADQIERDLQTIKQLLQELKDITVAMPGSTARF
jgi:two-component system chemotaxis response regulator CheB